MMVLLIMDALIPYSDLTWYGLASWYWPNIGHRIIEY
jgi:hypothetical protein